MRILGLVLIFICVSLGSAAVNRSTVWLISDELIYSINKGYQYCDRLGGTGASNVNTTLLTTSYFRIGLGLSTGNVDTGVATNPGGGTTLSTTNYMIRSLQLSFISTDSATPNLVFNLPVFNIMSTYAYGTGAGAVATGATASATLLTSVVVPGTYTTASGSTWVSVRQLASVNYPTINTAAQAGVSHVSLLLVDYKSSSTIAITQYQDGDDGANPYNHLYSIIVRTPTSLLTTSSDILVAGCTSTRSGSPTQLTGTCTVSGASDSSISGTAACTNTIIPNAVAASISAMNSLRTVDNYVFGAAGSNFMITANFGILIAISSIIFSTLH